MEPLEISFFNAVFMAFIVCVSLIFTAIIEICGNEFWLAQEYNKIGVVY